MVLRARPVPYLLSRAPPARRQHTHTLRLPTGSVRECTLFARTSRSTRSAAPALSHLKSFWQHPPIPIRRPAHRHIHPPWVRRPPHRHAHPRRHAFPPLHNKRADGRCCSGHRGSPAPAPLPAPDSAEFTDGRRSKTNKQTKQKRPRAAKNLGAPAYNRRNCSPSKTDRRLPAPPPHGPSRGVAAAARVACHQRRERRRGALTMSGTQPQGLCL